MKAQNQLAKYKLNKKKLGCIREVKIGLRLSVEEN